MVKLLQFLFPLDSQVVVGGHLELLDLHVDIGLVLIDLLDVLLVVVQHGCAHAVLLARHRFLMSSSLVHLMLSVRLSLQPIASEGVVFFVFIAP